MNFARRQVVEQLKDLRIAEGVANALWLVGFGKSSRQAVNGLEVSALHRPIEEAIELLT